MPESTESAADALFRSTKRRKIYRKRNADDQDDDGSLETSGSSKINAEAQNQAQLVKRPFAKKHGIGFSTAGSKPAQDQGSVTETSVVPLQTGGDDDRTAHDRFVKPAEKTAVIEDKHLTAYVDSKLAELRSLESVPNTGDGSTHGDAASTSLTEPENSIAAGNAADANPGGFTLGGPKPKQRNNQRGKQARPRRGPPQRDADTITRDAMVDQIMRESQVPIYDQPTSKTQDMQAEGFDADEAAAQAFRAEFLLSLAERQNRRRPAAPPAQQRGAAPVPTGPKLGGSRAQREKMKAIEEAKAAGKSVDSVPKRR